MKIISGKRMCRLLEQHGWTLARINGLSTVWVEASVPEVQAVGVSVGQPATVRLAGAAGEALRIILIGW